MEEVISTNAYKLIGDQCRLSERTVRDAFARKPVTYPTALRLSRCLGFDTTNCFIIKKDNRGLNKSKRRKNVSNDQSMR